MAQAMAAALAIAVLAIMLAIIWQPPLPVLGGLLATVAIPGMVALRRCRSCDAPEPEAGFCARCGA